MSAVKHPAIPAGTYPTNDTLITLTVDTVGIFSATSQEDVSRYVKFTDNRQNDPQGADPGTQHETFLIKNNFVTWVGAVQDSENHLLDKVMIYDVTSNSAFTRKPCSTNFSNRYVPGMEACISR